MERLTFDGNLYADMPEYIDKAAIKNKSVYSMERHELVVPVAEIDWMAPAKVEPIIEAEWVRKCSSDRRWWECSHCHNEPLCCNTKTGYLYAFSHRCPHCGAHMVTKRDN